MSILEYDLDALVSALVEGSLGLTILFGALTLTEGVSHS